MPSRYSIIQYVPNPIADERINIGVLAFDDRNVRVYFLQNWERVRSFGGENISYLQDFAQQMGKSAESGLLFPGDQDNGIPQYERLQNVAQRWMNSIQFTEPRGSLKDVDKVLKDAIGKFLIEPPTVRSPLRDLQAAAKLTIPQV